MPKDSWGFDGSYRIAMIMFNKFDILKALLKVFIMVPFSSSCRFLKRMTVVIVCLWYQTGHTQDHSYVQHELEGFEVYVNEKDYYIHPNEFDAALRFLGNKFRTIKKFGLEISVETVLASTPIYMDWNNGNYGSVVYNRGTNSVERSNQTFKKWKAIEILNTEIFLESDTANQPYLILHELAHGYHDRLGKFEKDMIALSYKNAMENGLYDRLVPNQNGDKVYAYARADEREYFAELTVAYLARNTTYPFHAKELEVHDPIGFGMVAAIWRYAEP